MSPMSVRLATDDPAEPLMGACERLDEIGIGLGSTLPLILNNQLGFDASPPKPDRHFDHDRSTVLASEVEDAS